MYGHQSGYYPLSSLQLISKHARKTERDQETWELNNIKLSLTYHDTPVQWWETERLDTRSDHRTPVGRQSTVQPARNFKHKILAKI